MRRVVITSAVTLIALVTVLAAKPHRPPDGPRARPSGGGTAPAAGRTGVFTGDVVPTEYGPVQLRITLAKGRLTRVEAVRLPDGNARDREIAASAVPQLTREALAAQSARIDAVSGATYTSDGYIQSLQSALDRSHG
ncbi:FMN-binding protein [Streptomyces qinglanensis]|uniref:FMN-binding protein n=1 Tax=Streptomyces qinglanensis TaxID=943816 RepID=UPI0009429E53|nr:FMN-binding protein [Streptomyces qinglanensis]